MRNVFLFGEREEEKGLHAIVLFGHLHLYKMKHQDLFYEYIWCKNIHGDGHLPQLDTKNGVKMTCTSFFWKKRPNAYFITNFMTIIACPKKKLSS